MASDEIDIEGGDFSFNDVEMYVSTLWCVSVKMRTESLETRETERKNV